MRGIARVDHRRVAGAADPQHRAGRVDAAPASGTRTRPSSGNSFSRASGSSGTTSGNGATSTRVRGGTRMSGRRAPASARPCRPASSRDAAVRDRASRARARPRPREQTCAPCLVQLALERVGDPLLDDQHRLVRAQDRVVERLRVGDAARRRAPGRRSRRPAPARCPARRRAPGCPSGRRRARPPSRRSRRSRRSSRRPSAPRSAGSSAPRPPAGSRPGRPRATAASASSRAASTQHLARQRVRADDDRVAGHQRQQDLEVDGRDRVRRRRQREHHARRAGHLDDLRARRRPARRRSRRRGSARACPREHASFLQLLVLGDAHAGLPHRPFGIPFGVLVCRLGDRLDDPLRALAGRSRRTRVAAQCARCSIIRARGTPAGSPRSSSVIASAA